MNTIKSPQQIIQDMVQRIVETTGPDKVILFGSYAREKASPDSDVDLLVVFQTVDSKRKKAVELHKLLAGIGLPKDIIVVSKDEFNTFGGVIGSIVHPAVSEGKVLYDRAA